MIFVDLVAKSIYANLFSDKNCSLAKEVHIFTFCSKLNSLLVIHHFSDSRSSFAFTFNITIYNILTLKLPGKLKPLYIFNNKSNQTQKCENITLRGYKWFANSTFFPFILYSKKKYDEKKSIKSLEKNIFHLKRPITWFIVVFSMIFASEAKEKRKLFFDSNFLYSGDIYI